MDPLRQAVVAEALTWVGTPYAHQGRVKGAAADCGMLLIEVFTAAGAADPAAITVQDYPCDWHLHHSEEKYLSYINQFFEQTQAPAEPGDVALFRFGRCISHGGIITQWPYMVHAYLRNNCVCIDNVAQSPELKSRLVGIWRLKTLVGEQQ